jgi:hypothetical protein
MERQACTVNEPIFLVGAERSGTTLLRLMLSHHPQIAWCPEFEYSVDQISETGAFPELKDYCEWLETHRIFTDCGYQIDRTLSYPDLIRSFIEQERDRTQKPIAGATVHRHFDRLLHIWSEARFIHIVRDPRDVAASCIGMGWAGNVWAGAERWIEAEDLWDKMRSPLSPERWIEVSYESLIENPQRVLSQICQFMGVNYDEAMLQYPETTTYSIPDPSLVRQWLRRLSPSEIQLVESRVAGRLLERGYEHSSLPPIHSLTPVRRLKLRTQDWLGRKQFRIKRYGFPLLMSDFLARRLRIKPWERETRLRINEIERAYLK